MSDKVAKVAYDMLKDVPSKNFIMGEYTNKVDKCCSMGHIQRLMGGTPQDYSKLSIVPGLVENEFISKLRTNAMIFMRTKADDIGYRDIVNVNDGEVSLYIEKQPKARVLHLLTDMIAAGL